MVDILDLCPKRHRLPEPLQPQVVHGQSWIQTGPVVGFDPETKTVYATRNFTGTEILENRDHFPGWVVMPAVLQLEFAAQACIQYAQFDPQYDGCLFTFIRVEADFRQLIPAGTELMTVCQLLTLPKPGTIRFGEAQCQLLTADGKLVMSAKIRFRVVTKSKTPLAQA